MRQNNFRRGQSQRPVKIDLKIDIKNFGPISKGSVNLAPLTIFIGPNNSGKSYMAMLIHSILSSENKTFRVNRFFNFSRFDYNDSYVNFYIKLEKIIEQNKNKESFDIPISLTKNFFRLIQNQFTKDLESEITRNFGASMCDLVKTKQKLANIHISNSTNHDISINKKLTINTNVNNNIKYRIKISSEIQDDKIESNLKNNICIINIHKQFTNRFHKLDLVDHILSFMVKQIKHNTIPANSYYFPAARSGILQGHKALSASIIKSAQFGGIQSFEIPKLTGVVLDFISNIILMSNKPEKFFQLAQQLENDLLHGHIKLPARAQDSFSEITYNAAHIEMPLHRTSSTISEIAPLSLYLKHIVSPSSLLIIEEPEAHLHPENQLIFAKYIVKMIRAGLNVLVTTHSVFLLEQLGKLMLASKIKPEIRKKELKLNDDEFLNAEEVSSYVFVKKNDDNHIIKPIETNNQDGISQEEFVKVTNLLYSDSIKLQKNLPDDQ